MPIMPKKVVCRNTVATALAVAMMAPAYAQDAGAGGNQQAALEDIVVTARKREENMMKVPIAVSVMSQAKIEGTGVKNLQDLSQFTPGLFTQTGSATGRADRSLTFLTFRGLSTSSGSLFIDGAPYVGSQYGGIGTPDVTDVARVEVLKGPQSVYFGRATFSGAVNYVTREPGNDFAGRVSADFYSYEGREGRLMLEGPIIEDALRARVTLRRYTFGGQYRSGVDRDHRLGKQSTTSGSIAIASELSPNLSLSAYYSYTLDEDGPAEATTIKQIGPGPTLTCDLGGSGGPYWCGELPTLSGRDPSNIGNNDHVTPLIQSEFIDNVRGYPTTFSSNWLDHYGLKRKVHHAHGRLDWNTDSGWQLATLFSYSETKFAQLVGLEGRDTSTTPNPFYISDPVTRAAVCAATPSGPTGNSACFAPSTLTLTTNPQRHTRNYSAEGRVSTPQDKPLRGTLGVSYFRLSGPPSASFGIQNSGRLINAGGGGIDEGVSTPAIFGGLYYDIGDRLTVSAEGRYQWDKISQSQTFPVASTVLKKTFTSFSPRVTADFRITPQSLLYANFSRGYRPGGFNAGILGLTPEARAVLAGQGALLAYNEEKLDNYEIGHKATWFDNRLRTTLALYYMNWSEGQVRQSNIFTANGTTSSIVVISNVGKVDLKGVEFDADLAVTDSLRVSGNANYSRNKIINYVYLPNGPRIQGSTDVNGNDLDHSPRLKGSASVTYERALTSAIRLSARVDTIFQSKWYVDPTNYAWVGGSTRVNARLGLVHNRKAKLELYVNNLFNDDHLREAAKANDSIYGPNTTCPPCTTSALPAVVSPGVSPLNGIFLGLPVKRTWGARLVYEF